MKKFEKIFTMKWYLFSIITLAAILYASCMSYPVDIERYVRKVVVWDENLPKEESVLLHFDWSTAVTSYNGIKVDWHNAAVYLPPGNIQLTLDKKNEYGHTNKTGHIFERTFAAGERYTAKFQNENAFDIILLEDLNEKKEWEDHTIHYLPGPPKTVLPGDPGSARLAGEATLVIGEGIFATHLNGSSVYDEFYPENRHQWRVNKETIQAGSSTVNFNFYYINHKINMNVFLMGQNLEFTYNFEAGKEYTVAFYSKLLNPFVTEYGVALYDYASTTGSAGSNSQIIRSWKLMEFNKPLGKFTNFSPETGEAI